MLAFCKEKTTMSLQNDTKQGTQEKQKKFFRVLYSLATVNDKTENLDRLVVSQCHWHNKYKIMQDVNTTICPLYVAIINHDQKEVEKLALDYGQIDPSSKYACGIHPKFETGRNWTYLVYAIHENYIPTVALLLTDVRVVRSIYKQNYQALRWCLEEISRTESLSLILDVIAQDKNEPTKLDLERIKFSMDVMTSYEARSRNATLLKEKWNVLPEWLKNIIPS